MRDGEWAALIIMATVEGLLIILCFGGIAFPSLGEGIVWFLIAQAALIAAWYVWKE